VKFQPLVAQRAEAPGSDPGGSWFESTRGDQQRAQRRSMRRRSIGRTPGCYPVHAGSTPAVAASHTRPLGAPGRRSRPPRRARAAPVGDLPGLCCSTIRSGPRRGATRRGVRGSNVPRSSNGRIFGSEPEDAWFESRPRSSPTDEAMAAGRAPTPRRRGFDSFRPCLKPRSSSGSRMPASQAGDAGSNPARGPPW
jgi:hypothetical protein